jgi:hypothetical protein
MSFFKDNRPDGVEMEGLMVETEGLTVWRQKARQHGDTVHGSPSDQGYYLPYTDRY